MPGTGTDCFYAARSVADAVAALAERGAGGAPLAGATWVMRAPLRGEPSLAYVSLSAVDALRHVRVTDHEIVIGACVTHAELVVALAGLDDCRALIQAAAQSANPAIREVATVGGNLCAVAFAAADLVPALLCLDAVVELETSQGPDRMTLATFLARRASHPPGWLLARIVVPRSAGRSAHARLPLRRAGDYPVAIVSVAMTLSPGGRVERARVAVGSVESVGRRWDGLESGLVGRPPDPMAARDIASARVADFHGRDGVEAPGWYREKVLPVLIQRAVRAIQA